MASLPRHVNFHVPRTSIWGPFAWTVPVAAGRTIEMVRPSRLTGTSATLKSLAIGASCAVAIRPPAAIITNIRYITQNTGVVTICPGV